MDGSQGPRALAALRSILDAAPAQLRAIPAERAASRPEPARWSPVEELGHLIDSAFNNHQRVVRVQLEDRPACPGYDGDAWVELHAYARREWQGLIDLWFTANRHLVTAAEAAGAAAWERTLTVGGSPVTLAFLLEDYVRHLAHHLRRIGIDPGVADA